VNNGNRNSKHSKHHVYLFSMKERVHVFMKKNVWQIKITYAHMHLGSICSSGAAALQGDDDGIIYFLTR
jgi:hypothetical protein